MNGLRGRARGTLALGAAVILVAAGMLTWVATSGDDAWHGGEPGVVMTPARPGESTANPPSPLPTGPEPVFPAPQRIAGGAPTGTPGSGDPSSTGDPGSGDPSPTGDPGAGDPSSTGDPGAGDPSSTGDPGAGDPSPTGDDGGGPQGTDAPRSESPGGGVQTEQPDSGRGG